MRFQKLFALAGIAGMLAMGLGCKGTPANVAAAAKPVVVTMWGIFDDEDAYAQLITAYRAAHPFVQIVYKKLRPEEYATALLNGFAEDQGPDIFLVHNTWMREYQSKLAPLPKTIQIAELVTTGTIQKQTAYELHDKPTLTIRSLGTLFPDQVSKDVVLRDVDPETGGQKTATEKIYGIPLSIDTLALYWNRDLLNAAGIAEPPVSWTDFQQDVKKLVKLDKNNNVLQAGAGIGGAKNVERGIDILSLLMMQNNTPMTDEDGNPTFTQGIPGADGDQTPGLQATLFYTDFANPNKEVYTWNNAMPNSLDAFVTGQSAMFLGYNYHLPLIRARAPKLKFGIAPSPQISGSDAKTFANYWVLAVSKKSKNQNIAWDVIQNFTSPSEATKYLTATAKPTALRSLIQSQADNLDIGVFANQILTAQSWYKGADSAAAEAAMNDIINDILGGGTASEALSNGRARVQQTMQPRTY